jgi:hypothetical protein
MGCLFGIALHVTKNRRELGRFGDVGGSQGDWRAGWAALC